MPALPTQPAAAPYDTVNAVLNIARVRLNDAIASIGGDVLQNTQPFTQTIAIAAWRRLQEFLAELGFARLTREAILTGLAPVNRSVASDPSSQVFLNWTTYYDGAVYNGAPVLPQDLLLPLKLWERATGTNAAFAPMENWLDGLPAWTKVGANRIWEWREESIYMPGALETVDIRLRYAAYLADFATTGEGPNQVVWYNQPVPIVRSSNALAFYICAETADARGDLDAGAFDQKAEAAARRIFNREVSLKQRVNIRRIARSSGSRGFDFI